ncbi:Protein of unknown function [Pyronema omphalodes CBS 100304]|uniref:Uncharacterized protein n=1 Tax=Pyronema omphalodes (strain CBS 100304) TaxID=1076935 RepID=U4LRN7_PYROM|nr:Protein of unknown function [Pyronema omphalodes CBS 100304]
MCVYSKTPKMLACNPLSQGPSQGVRVGCNGTPGWLLGFNTEAEFRYGGKLG